MNKLLCISLISPIFAYSTIVTGGLSEKGAAYGIGLAHEVSAEETSLVGVELSLNALMIPGGQYDAHDAAIRAEFGLQSPENVSFSLKAAAKMILPMSETSSILFGPTLDLKQVVNDGEGFTTGLALGYQTQVNENTAFQFNVSGDKNSGLWSVGVSRSM